MKLNKENILVVIPARSGSKGLPGKNIKKLNGKPLINYTIDAAKELFNATQIIVNTDDSEIAEVSKNNGASIPFLRPKELAQDASSTRAVLMHLIKEFERQKKVPQIIILLQPTSPFRNAQHIEEALELFLKIDCDMVVSVSESKVNPYFNLFEESKEGYLLKSKSGNFDRRQDLPACFEFNGAIYIFKTASLIQSEMKDFKKIVKYVMSKEDSIDIDDRFDWLLAQSILKKKIDEL